MDNIDFRQNREHFSGVESYPEEIYEQSVERDFVLPDYYPDIFRILRCTAKPSVISQSISGEKLTLQILTAVRVLYISENDSRIHSAEQKISFSKTVDLKGECVNPMITVRPKCEYINCRVVNRRRIDIRGAVTIPVTVYSETQGEIATDAFGCGIQLKKKPITYPAKRLCASKRITVVEELEMSASKPAVGNILDSTCTVIPKDRKIIAGKLVAGGDAVITVVYSCVDPNGNDTVETMTFSKAFSQIIDIDGIDEAFEAQIDIDPTGCEIISKGENGTQLECEITLIVSCTAVKYAVCEAVEDAYSTRYECELKRCTGSFRSLQEKVSLSKSVELTLRYPDGEIGCIYDCQSQCGVFSPRLDESGKKFMLSGNVRFSVLGCSSEKTPFCIEGETPFELEVPLPETIKSPEDTVLEPTVTVTGCSYRLGESGSTVEVNADISVNGTISEYRTGDVLSEINVLTDKPKERSESYALKLCYISEEEDIWEIAKRYSTSAEAIMEENDLSDSGVFNRSMLLIPLMN